MAIESSAGRSAQRQYELRRAQEQARRKQQWGPVGSLVAALAPQSQSTRAWAIGAEGERRLGARLDAISGDHIAVVHDRRIPYSQTNIDHLVVTAQGVWVIDAKRYKGRPERRTEGGMARPREEKLYVDRRDRVTSLKACSTRWMWSRRHFDTQPYRAPCVSSMLIGPSWRLPSPFAA